MTKDLFGRLGQQSRNWERNQARSRKLATAIILGTAMASRLMGPSTADAVGNNVLPEVNQVQTVETQESTGVINWEGQGSENDEIDGTEYVGWHWILTPGGSGELLRGTITVVYIDEHGDTQSITVPGYFPSEGGGQGKGAMHFDVIIDAL